MWTTINDVAGERDFEKKRADREKARADELEKWLACILFECGEAWVSDSTLDNYEKDKFNLIKAYNATTKQWYFDAEATQDA